MGADRVDGDETPPGVSMAAVDRATSRPVDESLAEWAVNTDATVWLREASLDALQDSMMRLGSRSAGLCVNCEQYGVLNPQIERSQLCRACGKHDKKHHKPRPKAAILRAAKKGFGIKL